MNVKRLLMCLLVVLLASCGTSDSPGSDDPATQHLLAAAERAAKNNGGEAKHVEAVKTTRGKAADLTGHSNLDQTEEVWVVEVSGDDYTCNVCSHPNGAGAPKGRYITLVLRASNFEYTDGGLGPEAIDLSAFGAVEVLRDNE